MQPVTERRRARDWRLGIAIAFGLMLTGCGASAVPPRPIAPAASPTAAKSTSPTQRTDHAATGTRPADSSPYVVRAVRPGCSVTAAAAPGSELVALVALARSLTPTLVATDYRLWVGGKVASTPGAPSAALCGLDREVVAALLLDYVRGHVAAFAPTPPVKVVGAVTAAGVDCGTECEIVPTAADRRLEAHAPARDTAKVAAANNHTAIATARQTARLGACHTTFVAVGRLEQTLNSVQSGVARSSAESRLAAEVVRVTGALRRLEPLLARGQRVRLQAALRTLGHVNGAPAVVIRDVLASRPLSSLLSGEDCRP